jgi:hypothetical protein
MAQPPPQWLQLVQKLERTIGVPVESLVRTDAYFDALTKANRARSKVNGTIERLQSEWLHLFNLPAASDIRGLRVQLSRVERRLNELAKEVADLEGEAEERRLAEISQELADLEQAAAEARASEPE